MSCALPPPIGGVISFLRIVSGICILCLSRFASRIVEEYIPKGKVLGRRGMEEARNWAHTKCSVVADVQRCDPSNGRKRV